MPTPRRGDKDSYLTEVKNTDRTNPRHVLAMTEVATKAKHELYTSDPESKTDDYLAKTIILVRQTI